MLSRSHLVLVWPETWCVSSNKCLLAIPSRDRSKNENFGFLSSFWKSCRWLASFSGHSGRFLKIITLGQNVNQVAFFACLT